ncbi:tol protein [Fusarium oxysporum f. sp. phaseoli]
MASCPSRLCTLCEGIFKGELPDSRQWLSHHKRADLLAASRLGCFICRTVVKSRSWDAFPEQAWDTFQYHILYERDQSGLEFQGLTIRPSLNTGARWSFRNETLGRGKQASDFYTPRTDPFGSDLPQKWIQDCIDNHTICNQDDPSYRPTRLLEIIDSKRLRLVETSTSSTGPYVSFSHCWGNQEMLMLKAENLDQFRTEIPVEVLPKKYQEAINFSSRLNIHFIWIDSLCIIQDDGEDWQREAVTMKKVYGCSLLNICSAAATDVNGVSFRGRDPGIMEALFFTSSWDGEEQKSVYLEYDTMWDDILNSPLRKRAWVFQEWYLSPRSLILAHSQLWWHCRKRVACEQHPENHWNERSLEGMKDSKQKAKPWLSGAQIWETYVREYVGTRLTQESDRLIAFAGVAQGFGQSQKEIHDQYDPENIRPDLLVDVSSKIFDQYLAGLWRSHLPQALCWGTDNTFTRSMRTSAYTAPSWSWASMTGPIQLAGLSPFANDTFVSVESVWLKHADESHSTGLIHGGYIKLRGHLIGPLTLEHQELPKVSSKGRIEVDDATTYLPKVTDGGNFDTWGGVLYPDEMTQDTSDRIVPLLSYLDNLTPGLCERGIIDNASRKTERLEEAKGRYFCLPVVRDECFVKNGRFLFEDSFETLYCLALFQPTHQDTVFHRIGMIRFEKEIPSEQFEGTYAKTTITVL